MFGIRDNSLVDLIENELAHAGLDRSHIHRNESIALPGSYNPSPRKWDLVVLDGDVPVAAVNAKASTGPSVGKNFNNRLQEILGDAVDLGRPYESETLRALKPCLALFFALEDSDASNRILRPVRSGFANEQGFPEGMSYKDRYGAFFERLIRDGRYDVICYLTSTRSNDPSISEPKSTMGFANFAQSIVDRITKIRKLREDSPVDPAEFGRMLARRDDLGNVVLGIASAPTGLSAAEATAENGDTSLSSSEAPMPPRQYQYDVCLSFAGEQRKYVDQVASHLVERGIKTFYDDYEQAELWGKDLYEHLDSVYRLKARYCVLFASADYARKVWTSHERKSAQARAYSQSEEYILPVKFDNTDIPGLRPTTGYIDAQKIDPARLASLISEKLNTSQV